MLAMWKRVSLKKCMFIDNRILLGVSIALTALVLAAENESIGTVKRVVDDQSASTPAVAVNATTTSRSKMNSAAVQSADRKPRKPPATEIVISEAETERRSNFDELDIDGDGYIDVPELNKAPYDYLPGNKLKSFVGNITSDRRNLQPGRVDTDLIRQLLSKLEHENKWWSSVGRDGSFDIADVNGDGFLTREEDDGRWDSRREHEIQLLIQHYDDTEDGKLEFTEYAAPLMDVLHTTDKDLDGVVTLEELGTLLDSRSTATAAQPRGKVARVGDVQPVTRPLTKQDSEVVFRQVLVPPTDPDAPPLFKTVRITSTIVASEAKAELSANFVELDTDKDGYLDFSELDAAPPTHFPIAKLQSFVQSLMHLNEGRRNIELWGRVLSEVRRIRLSHRNPHRLPNFDIADINGDGLLSRDEVFGRWDRIDEFRLQQQFQTYDINGDNNLEFSEFAAPLLDLLQKADEDEDGEVSLQELGALIAVPSSNH